MYIRKGMNRCFSLAIDLRNRFQTNQLDGVHFGDRGISLMQRGKIGGHSQRPVFFSKAMITHSKIHLLDEELKFT
jgi:hypothetical protein